MSGFRKRTLRALGWSAASRLSRQLVAFGVAILLARLLDPSAFGLIAMVTVFSSFALLFADLGFGAALIQRRDTTDAHLSSVFWANVLAGVVLTVLFYLAAPLIADVYDEPVLESITRALSISFFLGSLTIVQRSMLRKRLEFRALAMAEVAGVAVAGVVAVAMALNGFGVWALVAKALVAVTVTAIILWVVGHFRPRFVVSREALRDLFGFSGNFLGNQALNYWTRNIDNLMIGRVIGSAALGIYSQAYYIFLLPLDNISNVFGNVMFASMSEIQDDRERVRRVYLRMTRAIGLFAFPVMAGLFVFAHELVLCTYGARWLAMVPLLKVFALVGVTASIRTVTGNLFLSQGRADLQFRVGIFLKLNKIFWLVAAVYLTRDIFWVAVALAFSSWTNMYPGFRYAGRLVGLTFTDEVRHLSGIFGCALAAGVAMWLLRFAIVDATPAWATLLLGLMTGGAVYWLSLRLFAVAGYHDLIEILKSRGRGASAATRIA